MTKWLKIWAVRLGGPGSDSRYGQFGKRTIILNWSWSCCFGYVRYGEFPNLSLGKFVWHYCSWNFRYLVDQNARHILYRTLFYLQITLFKAFWSFVSPFTTINFQKSFYHLKLWNSLIKNIHPSKGIPSHHSIRITLRVRVIVTDSVINQYKTAISISKSKPFVLRCRQTSFRLNGASTRLGRHWPCFYLVGKVCQSTYQIF